MCDCSFTCIPIREYSDEEMKAIASDNLAIEINSDKDYLSQNEKLREESIQMSRFLGEKLMRPHKKGR